MAPLLEIWIASAFANATADKSSLSLPCANASRLSQAMTAASAVRNNATLYAGTGRGRSFGTGLNVSAMKKAPRPMIDEPI